ncbi:hypothetical protein CCR97_09130 [Rhodoplanes elegans]|uniref:Helicase/UvrB N-terminal domain-containing protein n=1 Tax=Rhodoplanes elegans TaxID=29408 RepID=A0A327K3P8_9BRAD|nr:hypothetical protein [Rhodoplanes elegans]MBK5958371.1 hypothetical protein [Rhodoplanes elegans]RAI32456.1 hypothetical protein CH338_24110 [Rhodoplanes elegans]
MASTSKPKLAELVREDIYRPGAALALIGGAAAEPIMAAPTYPDRTAPRDVARAMLKATLDQYFGEQVPAERRERQGLVNRVTMHHLAERWIPYAIASHDLRQWRPEAVLIKAEAGIGKSSLVYSYCVKAINRGLRVVYAVPSLKLAEEAAAELRALGADVHAYRGFSKPDPDAPGYQPSDDATDRDGAIKMCLDESARKAAVEIGAPSVDVCGSPDSDVKCRFFDVCGYNRQRNAQPAIWVMPHALLAGPWPEFVPLSDVLIIDESFLGSMIDDAAAVPLDSLLDNYVIRTAEGTVDDVGTLRLQKLRSALHSALDGLPPGAHLSAEVLRAAGLHEFDAMMAVSLEWSRRPPRELSPNMPAEKRDAVVAAGAETYRSVRIMADIWDEVAFVLRTGRASGSLTVRGSGGGRKLAVRPLRRLDEKLHGSSILMIDATPPTVEQIQNVLGCRVRVALDQPVARSPHSYLIQITDAPVSATTLGIARRTDQDGKLAEERRRNRRYMHNLACFLAAMFPHDANGLFSQKALKLDLIEKGLPANIIPGNFNGVTGRNDWRNTRSNLVIGRPMPSVRDAEVEAEVTFCGPVAAVAADAHKKTLYRKERAYIRCADGRAHPVDVLVHPDPRAESRRRQMCEHAEVQALARDRAVNRTEDNPVVSWLVADVVLDVTVDAVVPWCDLAWAWRTPAEVWRDGVLFAGWRENERAYAGVSQDDAKHVAKVAGAIVAEGGWVGFPYMESPCKGNPPNLRGRVARYQKRGPGQTPSTAVILPNGPQTPAAIRAWLKARLGCEIAMLDVERRRLRDLDAAERRQVLAPAIAAVREMARPLARLAPLPLPVARAIVLPGVVVRLGAGLIRGLVKPVSGSPVAKVGSDAGWWWAA